MNALVHPSSRRIPFQTPHSSHSMSRLLQLLLRPELIAVPTLLLAAVGRPWRQTCVALAADHLFAIVLRSQGLQRGLDDATTEAKHQVEGGFLQAAPSC